MKTKTVEIPLEDGCAFGLGETVIVDGDLGNVERVFAPDLFKDETPRYDVRLHFVGTLHYITEDRIGEYR